MEKFIPYEKLSKKEKRRLDSQRRTTWGWDVYFLVMQRIKEVFDQQGIEMTYPHLNVHLDK